MFRLQQFDAAVDGIEAQADGVALVEEFGAEQLDITKLTGGEFLGEIFTATMGDGGLDATRDVDVDALFLEFPLFLLAVGRYGNGLEVVDGEVVGLSRQVVGIDDSKYSSICDIPLTTVRHPHQVLGEAAAKCLLRQIETGSEKAEDTIFVPELVVRDSVRKLETQSVAAQDYGYRW